MMKTYNWGIIGVGQVAYKVAAALKGHPQARIHVAYSRCLGKAEEFAKVFSIPKASACLEQVLSDESVDIIYIATPNHTHRGLCLAGLQAGKHVLCEKPLAVNADEVGDIIKAQDGSGYVVMEAMWSRFLPVYAALRSLLDDKAIGPVFAYEASLGHCIPFDGRSRFYDRSMGGGALLDLGVYPLSLAQWLFGDIYDVSANLSMVRSMVENDALLVTRHTGVTGDIKVSFRRSLRNDMVIYGENGRIEVDAPLYRPRRLRVIQNEAMATHHTTQGPSLRERLRLNQGLFSTYEYVMRLINRLRPSGWQTLPYYGNGYVHQIDGFLEAIEKDMDTVKTMPLAESMKVLQAIDRAK